METAAASSCSPPPPPSEEEAPSAVDRFPDHLWEHIFSFLPVSSLLVSRAVCRLWNSILRSGTFSSFYPVAAAASRDRIDDVYFLLFADVESDAPFAAAYRPSRDRWVSIPLPCSPCAGSCCRLRGVHVSGGSIVLAELNKGPLVVYDFFTRAGKEIAPMISFLGHSYALGLIDEGPSGYKIVAVTTVDRVFSQVYNSRTHSWTLKGEFLGQFAVLGNSAFLDGNLYCLSLTPNHLLAFDPVSGDWSIVDVAMPSPYVVCSHILVHGGSLFLIGGEEEAGDITKISIWELDRENKRWRELGFMPDELLQKFRGRRMNHFYTVDRRGVVCFCNTSSYVLLMCNLRGMRWWWPRQCPFRIPKNEQSWLGHALEPQIGVVTGA